MTKNWNELVDDLASLDAETTTQIINKNNLLIVDGNNLAYRYLKRANYANYADDYNRTIESLGKSYSAKRIIVCMDYGKSWYRRSLFPEYKDNRKQPETEEDKKHYDDFFACLNKISDELPFDCIKLRGVESDDIMAYLILNCKAKFDHIWVITSDKDIFQLIDTNVSIFNLYSRKEIDLDYLQNELNITPEEYRLARIIQGDAGDNIKGVEGIGEVRSRELAKKYITLNGLIAALPIKSKAKYINNLNNSIALLHRNEKLINLVDYHRVAIEKGEDGIGNWEIISRITL